MIDSTIMWWCQTIVNVLFMYIVLYCLFVCVDADYITWILYNIYIYKSCEVYLYIFFVKDQWQMNEMSYLYNRNSPGDHQLQLEKIRSRRQRNEQNAFSSSCLSAFSFKHKFLDKETRRLRSWHTGSVCLWNASSLDFRTSAVSSFHWINGSPVTCHKKTYYQYIVQHNHL